MDIKGTVELFKKSSIFEGLGEADLKKIAEGCFEQACPIGTVIIEENDLPKELLFLIKHGEIVVSAGPAMAEEEDEEGAETMITTLGPGEVFGEIALIDEMPHSATVKTISDVVLITLPASYFLKLVDQDKNIGYIITRNIAKVICKRLRDSNFITRHFVQWGAPDDFSCPEES